MVFWCFPHANFTPSWLQFSFLFLFPFSAVIPLGTVWTLQVDTDVFCACPALPISILLVYCSLCIDRWVINLSMLCVCLQHVTATDTHQSATMIQRSTSGEPVSTCREKTAVEECASNARWAQVYKHTNNTKVVRMHWLWLKTYLDNIYGQHKCIQHFCQLHTH